MDTSPDRGQLLHTCERDPGTEDSFPDGTAACPLPAGQLPAGQAELPDESVSFVRDTSVASGSLSVDLLPPGIPARPESLHEMPTTRVTSREKGDISDQVIDRIIRFHYLKRKQRSLKYPLAAVLGMALALAGIGGAVAFRVNSQQREDSLPETAQPVHASRASLALTRLPGTMVPGTMEAKE